MKSSIKFITAAVVILIAVIVIGIALSNSQSSQQQTAESSTALDAMVGKQFSNIALYDKSGKAYTVDNFKGKNTVLFFSEGIMCYPACWNEIAALANDSKLNNQNTQVFSVVTDQPSQWDTAKNQMPALAHANMLFDQGSVLSRQLGILSLPSSMHVGQMPGHTYIILDKNGVVNYVYDDPNMAQNSDKLAAALAKLNN